MQAPFFLMVRPRNPFFAHIGSTAGSCIHPGAREVHTPAGKIPENAARVHCKGKLFHCRKFLFFHPTCCKAGDDLFLEQKDDDQSRDRDDCGSGSDLSPKYFELGAEERNRDRHSMIISVRI